MVKFIQSTSPHHFVNTKGAANPKHHRIIVRFENGKTAERPCEFHWNAEELWNRITRDGEWYPKNQTLPRGKVSKIEWIAPRDSQGRGSSPIWDGFSSSRLGNYKLINRYHKVADLDTADYELPAFLQNSSKKVSSGRSLHRKADGLRMVDQHWMTCTLVDGGKHIEAFDSKKDIDKAVQKVMKAGIDGKKVVKIEY